MPSNLVEPFTFDVATEGLTVGNHQFNLRVQDNIGKWSVLSSEPFEVIEANGIAEVVWTLPIDISFTDGACILCGKSDTTRGNCQVELVTMSGVLLASSVWSAEEAQLSIPLSVPSGSVVIVTVTDVTNDKKVVRRVMKR